MVRIKDLYLFETGIGKASLVAHVALPVVIYTSVTAFYAQAMYLPNVIYFHYYPAAICIGLYFLYCNYPEKSIGSCMILTALLSLVSMILFMVQLNMTEPADELYNGQYFYPLWNVTHQVTVNVTNRQNPPMISYYTFSLVMSFLVFTISILWFGFGFYMSTLDGINEPIRYRRSHTESEQRKHFGVPWVPVNIVPFAGKHLFFYNKLRFGISVLSLIATILGVILALATYFYLGVGLIVYSPFSNVLFVLLLMFVISIKPPPSNPPIGDPAKMELFERCVYDHDLISLDSMRAYNDKHEVTLPNGGKTMTVKIYNENLLWGFGEMSWCQAIYIVFFLVSVLVSWIVWIQHALWRDYNGIGIICTNIK